MRKPFWEKNLTLQNLHNVFSNQEDYNTLAMQVLIGAHHHNLNSDLDLERLLLAPSLKNRTRWFKHLPKPSFISDLQLGNHLWSYKTMGKTTMPHVTHLSFVTPRIVFFPIILSSSLDPHKSHIMSCLYSKNSPSILF